MKKKDYIILIIIVLLLIINIWFGYQIHILLKQNQNIDRLQSDYIFTKSNYERKDEELQKCLFNYQQTEMDLKRCQYSK